MSDRTEQLILMLTPEEKARIERLAQVTQQTMIETVLAGVQVLEERYAQEDRDDDDVIDIEANIRQAVSEIKAGKFTPITSVWDILDKPDDTNV